MQQETRLSIDLGRYTLLVKNKLLYMVCCHLGDSQVGDKPTRRVGQLGDSLFLAFHYIYF